MGTLVLLQAAALIALVLVAPELVDGIGSWLMWLFVIASNMLIARRYFNPQERRLQ